MICSGVLRFPWLILSSKIEVHGKPKSLFNDGPLFQGQATLADLKEKTLRYAKRLALISPEALEFTKLSINRGADVAGFTNAMQAGLDVVAPLYAAKTDVGVQFTEIRQRDGLPAALKWRRDQFAQYDD
jgi:hypothetical protein